MMRRFVLLICVFLFQFGLIAQEEGFIEESVKLRLDSINKSIKSLESEMPKLKRSRSYQLFYKKQELEKLRFLLQYEKYLINEELQLARNLIEVSLRAAENRKHAELTEFYLEYRKRLNAAVIAKREHYQELFGKEKNFRKVLYGFLEEKNDYNISRAEQMVYLANKFATENNLESVLDFLKKYDAEVNAMRQDFESEFELEMLTSNKNKYMSVVMDLIESDSINDILKAQRLVNECYQYSLQWNTKLTPAFFEIEQNVVLRSISDWYKRQGIIAQISEFNEKSVIAQRDSVNVDGVYRWNDYILVIGEMDHRAKMENVKRGEAIIHADKKLLEYIRVNRLAKFRRSVKVGTTALIPFKVKLEENFFIYNLTTEKWQYIIVYTRLKSAGLTDKLITYLPPIQFDFEITEDDS